MNSTVKTILQVTALAVALIVGYVVFQNVQNRGTVTPTQESAMTLYAEGIHSAITVQRSRDPGYTFPPGGCETGYRVGDTLLTPPDELAALVADCRVEADNTGRPVVVVRHKRGVSVTVP